MDPGNFENSDAALANEYIRRARQTTRQPTDLGFEAEGGRAGGEGKNGGEGMHLPYSTRGDEYSDSVSCFVFPALRMGFILQAISLALVLCIYHGHGGSNSFNFDLYNFTNGLRISMAFAFAVSICLLGYLAGTMNLLVFQSFLMDNGKFSRGFRAGSKIFNTALLLDMLSTSFRLLSFTYGYHFLQSRWWTHYTQTKADFTLFNAGALLHGTGLICYGVGIHYMEGYHDEGSYEEFGWAAMMLYGLSGLMEITTVLLGWGACAPVINLLALIVAIVWSMSFEPLLHFHATALHDRMVNDDLLHGNGGFQEIETTMQI